jgi:hypothetical protein
MKIRKLPEYLFNKIDELIDEDCSGMTLEEKKRTLGVCQRNPRQNRYG